MNSGRKNARNDAEQLRAIDTPGEVYHQAFEVNPHSLYSFPFPFIKDSYRYSANVQPAGIPVATVAGQWGENTVVVDSHYLDEITERARVFAQEPTRISTLPNMDIAQWDTLHSILTELSLTYPQEFQLHRDGDSWTFFNQIKGQRTSYVIGDPTSLAVPPLEFAAMQIQEDIVLLDQREEMLWADALAVFFAADWSPRFDVGMSFPEIHGPVPRMHDEGIVDRAHQFIMSLESGQRYRRTNWTLTVDGRLDTATESYVEWGRNRREVAEGPLADVGSRLFLRVEVQHLIRLEWSGAILFLIRTHLQPLAAIASVPEWGERTRAVLADLPDDMAEYKGIARTRPAAIAWLDSVLPPSVTTTDNSVRSESNHQGV